VCWFPQEIFFYNLKNKENFNDRNFTVFFHLLHKNHILLYFESLDVIDLINASYGIKLFFTTMQYI